jgi:hypothetical protein
MKSLMWQLCCIGISASLTGSAAGQDAQPIPERQDSRVNSVLDERGALDYVATLYDAQGKLSSQTKVQGLVMPNETTRYTSVGGPYYADEFGNLVRLGTIVARQYAGGANYAVTFLRNGGMQLAIDFRRDRVIDAVFDVTPGGAYGVFANPELGPFVDCFIARATAGEDPLEAANNCLRGAKAGGEDGGGPGVPSLAPKGEYDRLSEPDCGDGSGRSGGVPEDVRQPGATDEEGWSQIGRVSSTSEDGNTRTTVTWFGRENGGGTLQDSRLIVESRNRVTGEEAVQWTTVDHSSDGRTSVVQSRHRVERLSDGSTRTTDEMYVNGRRVSRTQYTVDSAGRCTGDCPRDDSDDSDDSDAGTSSSEGADGGEADAGTPPDGGQGDAGQPGPQCELEGTCPHEDPRCSAPRNDAESLWECVARTGQTPLECLARLQDAVFAGTGCAPIPGPDDGTTRQCPQNLPRSFLECLQEGSTAEECLRQSLMNAGAADIAPSELDDLTAPFRNVGASDIEYVEMTGVGAVLFALCNRGMEQFCRRNPGVF